MENTFNKLFELEECAVKALKETIFDCLQAYLWPGYFAGFEILGEELRVWCEEPNQTIEFNEDEHDGTLDLPIRMSTANWALLATIKWYLLKDEDDEGGFHYCRCWPTRFTMHCFKGNPRDLKATFMTAKMIGMAE